MSVEHTILSLLFVPHESVDQFYPVLVVGWTLNMEMYFYAMFTVAIAINRTLAPILVVLTIMGIKVGLPLVTSDPAYLFYYTHDFVQCFCLGIVVWYGAERIKEFNLPMWRGVFPISMSVYAGSIVFGGVNPLVAVTLLFALAVVSAQAGADVTSPWIILLGNASYACYLLHTILIYAIGLHWVPLQGTVPFAIGVIGLSWVCAIAWHMSVEKMIHMVRDRSLGALSVSSRAASSTLSQRM